MRSATTVATETRLVGIMVRQLPMTATKRTVNYEPTTLHELVEITGHSYSAIRNALDRHDSVRRITPGVRGESGLLAVRDPQSQPQPSPNPVAGPL